MKKFFTKKRIIWTVVILVVVGGGYRLFSHRNTASAIQTDTVKTQNLQQTVLTTGQVVSAVDLDLSFQSSGVVKQVMVKEGDNVKEGQTLAVLDQTTALASLTSARGTLAQAQANYDKILAGASNEAINVAQKAVDAAQVTLDNAQKSLGQTKAQQDVLVKNAYSALLNSGVTATPGQANVSSDNPTISGTYTGTEQGQYKVSLYNGGSGLRYTVSGLETGEGPINSGAPVPLGSRGLYIQFPSSALYATDYWTVDLPNTRASTYLANSNAYQAALQTQQSAVTAAQATVNTAQTALAQAQANLDQERAAARPADIEAAKAQILSAQGQVVAATATWHNTMIQAPANGTITQVDIKVGEQATALKEVMVLQDVGNLHAEANVSEANVASLQVGQSVDYTFDALGPDRHFQGTVQTINPASTVISGVVDYKVTATIPSDIPDIKSGMTANMTISVAKKDNVLAVPSGAVINQNGKQYVRVVDDAKKGTYHQVEVQTGLQADGGLVEITSGLSDGQLIVTYVKP